MSEPNKNPENTESLFLLELLFDSVEIDYPKLNLDANVLKCLKQACIRFQFLNYPVLEVCEEDFCNSPDDYKKAKIKFASGKSCLFSLRSLPLDIRCLDVCLSVVRQRDNDSCVPLGKARISLGSSFTNILTSLDDTNEPASKNSKDTHPLLNENGQVIGKITAFIRLSCFGKMIITQFQVSGDENKSFLFKGARDPIEGEDDLCRPEQSTVSDPYIRENLSPAGDASRNIPPECNNGPQDCQMTFPTGDAPSLQGMPTFQDGMPSYETGMPNFQDVMSDFQGGMPNFQGGLPNFQGGMPNFQGGMPNYQSGMPNFQGGMPNFQGGMPNFQGCMPNFQGGMPGVPGGLPGYPGGFPGPTNGFPGMQGPDAFNYQQGVPNAQGDLPRLPGVPSSVDKDEDEDESDFKEIGVEINGHSLSIKVPKRKKKVKVENPPIPFCGKMCPSETSSESDDTVPIPAPPLPDFNFCGCDVPLPPGFGVPPPPPPPKKKKKPKCPLEQKGNYCLKTDCPMGLPPFPNFQNKTQPPPFQTPPGAIGVKGDQVIFQMASNKKPGFETNPNAQYSFPGNAESNLQKVQLMTDNQAGMTGGPCPYNDVFLLKVGQKNLDTGKRSMMNVELKSPRKEEKKMVDEQTQYETGAPAAKEKKGKKGGKKGKGTKGKKKK